MRACEVTVVVEGKEIISMNEQAHGGDQDAILYKAEILECAEMLIAFCGGRKSQELVEVEKSASTNKDYTAALRVFEEFVKSKGVKDSVIDFPIWLGERLNLVENTPNSA